ncbi:hypothetical protein HID58_001792 [Brassica napus]|uniref:Uncharacterized protein n=1 Tax=Brassica napus TaxID=3708 RepID=A0ABQ8EKD3_BRANA|nr:hypothetical protein HID58_001792 [Brassica napus]
MARILNPFVELLGLVGADYGVFEHAWICVSGVFGPGSFPPQDIRFVSKVLGLWLLNYHQFIEGVRFTDLLPESSLEVSRVLSFGSGNMSVVRRLKSPRIALSSAGLVSESYVAFRLQCPNHVFHQTKDREIIDDVIIESTSKLNKSHTLVCRADPTAKHINESLKMNPG